MNKNFSDTGIVVVIKKYVFFILLVNVLPTEAVTRLSALHIIPDADLVRGGQIITDCQSYFYTDESEVSVFRPIGTVGYGINEWVNIYVGYVGGVTFGFKARILGEASGYLPSLAVGVSDIVSHREAYFFTEKDTLLKNELYIALGKSIDRIKLRFHAGMQSIPVHPSERYNPFFGIEKYLGGGAYITFETHRRASAFHFSLFGTWRFWGNRIEIAAGCIDVEQMLLDEQNRFQFTPIKPSAGGYVKPGIWAGIRFNFGLGSLNVSEPMSIEERFTHQQAVIGNLQTQVDSLKSVVDKGYIEKSHGLREPATDNIQQRPISMVVKEKLLVIRNLYKKEPYEPHEVKSAIRDLVSYHEKILPALRYIIGDTRNDRRMRTLAVMILGEIGNRDASDAIIDLLAKTSDPDIKVESIIALGKMKETRVGYLLTQLSNDPDEGVAFAAREVLRRLEKETNVVFDSGFLEVDSNSVIPKYVGESANINPEYTRSDTAGTDTSSSGSETDVGINFYDTTSGEDENVLIPTEEISFSEAFVDSGGDNHPNKINNHKKFNLDKKKKINEQDTSSAVMKNVQEDKITPQDEPKKSDPDKKDTSHQTSQNPSSYPAAIKKNEEW